MMSPFRLLLYAPGSGNDYGCSFTIDAPAEFSLQAKLLRYARVTLFSETNGAPLYDKLNLSTSPFATALLGTLSPGEYSIWMGAGFSGTVSTGTSHQLATGGFTDFLFTVQVPEPSFLAFAGLTGAMVFRRRRQLTMAGATPARASVSRKGSKRGSDQFLEGRK